MLDVIVKGLKVVAVSDCCGYLFTANVTFALPCNVLKSGTNLLTAKNTSPAIVGPVDLPCAFRCLDCKSKSYDFTNDVTVVVLPFGLT